MKKHFISCDIGTENILIYSSLRGIVFNEPSIMAYDDKKKKIVALGDEAYNLLGKENKYIKLIRPMKEGVIANTNTIKEMLKAILEKTKLNKIWKNSTVLLTAPTSVTDLEHNSLKDLGTILGSKEVHVEEEIKMAAIGCDVNIFKPEGNIFIDIGGGTTDVAVIASGDIAVADSIKIAGRNMTEEIIKYLRTNHNIMIGEKTAEKIKITLGTLKKNAPEESLEIQGRDVISGLPKEVIVVNSEVREIITPFFNNIADLIAQILEKTDPELIGDIYNNGFYFCGGGSLIKGIDEYFSNIFKISAQVVVNPLLTVIEGTKHWKNIIGQKNNIIY